jgi:N-acetylglutamate synthase-like GNAT family acetyltransferase
MYVRDAKNREEVWLLDRIEEMGLDDTAFRSRDYVIAIDEETGAKAGFGRLRVHKVEESENVCEFTSVGVVDGWREQGVGAHVVERLVRHANDQGFETVYALTEEPGYLGQFGFRRIDESALPPKLRERLSEKREGVAPDAVPASLDLDRFRMPDRLRERFKVAQRRERDTDDDAESPEEFGIDPDSATYKYDTGG